MSKTPTSRTPGVYGRPAGVRRLTYTWVKQPATDIAAALALIPWLLVPVFTDSRALITDLEPATRQAVFQTLTTLSATLAGFVLTSVSILINLMRTPLSTLDQIMADEDKVRVGTVFLAALRPLAAAFAASLAAFLTDVEKATGNPIIELVAFACLAASLSAIARVVWVMRRLLSITNTGAGG
jgi:hypothetical protein